jgi:hypothetical protein
MAIGLDFQSRDVIKEGKRMGLKEGVRLGLHSSLKEGLKEGAWLTRANGRRPFKGRGRAGPHLSVSEEKKKKGKGGC